MALGTAEIVKNITQKPSGESLLQTHDLHTFVQEYERAYPNEVVHIQKPINGKWEITALTMKLEREKRFPCWSSTTSSLTASARKYRS
jgi:hypothetical protein